MKILVTGATGFLGSHLVKTFLEEGHQVIILKRSFSDTRRIADILPRVTTYDLDRCSLEEPFEEQGKIDSVIHAATCYGRSGESVSEIFEANAAFPLRLLETATSFAAAAFFNTDTSLDRFLNPYALAKKQFADWGRLFACQGRIRFVNVELEHFYGAGDDASKFLTHVINSCLDNVPELPLTAGEQRRDFIHIDDVVAAYLLLVKNNSGSGQAFQEYDLGSGEAIGLRELVETVLRLTGSKTHLNFGALPYRDNEVMESHADIRSLVALGWSCKVSLADGLRKTIEEEASRRGAKGTH